MIKIIKHEWHQVDSQYTFDLTPEVLEEIYPEMTKKERKELLNKLKKGEVTVDELMTDAYHSDVEFEWNHDYDDWWTDRKGGYDVTYEIMEK